MCLMTRTAVLLITFSLAWACIASGPAGAATIRVPSDQPSIQAGIDAAERGDTVLVAPGVYLENIDFRGKAITVAGEAGAEQTIIDGTFSGPVVTFRSAERQDSVLTGFTLQGGGGAITTNPIPVMGPGELQSSNTIPRSFRREENPNLNKHLTARQAYLIEGERQVFVQIRVFFAPTGARYRI